MKINSLATKSTDFSSLRPSGMLFGVHGETPSADAIHWQDLRVHSDENEEEEKDEDDDEDEDEDEKSSKNILINRIFCINMWHQRDFLALLNFIPSIFCSPSECQRASSSTSSNTLYVAIMAAVAVTKLAPIMPLCLHNQVVHSSLSCGQCILSLIMASREDFRSLIELPIKFAANKAKSLFSFMKRWSRPSLTSTYSLIFPHSEHMAVMKGWFCLYTFDIKTEIYPITNCSSKLGIHFFSQWLEIVFEIMNNSTAFVQIKRARNSTIESVANIYLKTNKKMS
uniref:Uncharacterized protein n=1 Tax=Glossina palpalis gambiensis TaxID=67801 RepID=A0A1B0AW43_9MUSC